MGSLIPGGFSNFPRTKDILSWDIPSMFKHFSDKLPAFFEEGRSSGLSVSSDENKIYIEANVPGLTAADIDVSLDEDGLLWIRGEKKTEEKDETRKVYQKSQNSFSYCLSLGNEVNLESEPEAVCKDGVMKLTFTKYKKEKKNSTRKIQVK